MCGAGPSLPPRTANFLWGGASAPLKSRVRVVSPCASPPRPRRAEARLQGGSPAPQARRAPAARTKLQHLDQFLAAYGYFAIFGLLMLGIVGPFIPDDTILVLSGIAIHRGQLHMGTTIAVAYAGSLCGITISYALGRSGAVYVLERFGPVRCWIERHLPQVQRWFDRYGKWTLFFGYFIAGVRHFTALAAGMSRVKPGTFALYAFPGGLVWVASFISIGYFLGVEWEQIRQRFNRGAFIAAGVVALIGIASWFLQRRRSNTSA